MNTCKSCGTDNSPNATFCRNCGQPLSGQTNSVSAVQRNKKPAWYTFLKGLSLIMIIYGLFALITIHSNVYRQEYRGDGHNDYVITEHSDAIGLIKSVGYGYSMTEGTPVETIIEDSMAHGRNLYYPKCVVLIIIGSVIWGVSALVSRNKNKKAS